MVLLDLRVTYFQFGAERACKLKEFFLVGLCDFARIKLNWEE